MNKRLVVSFLATATFPFSPFRRSAAAEESPTDRISRAILGIWHSTRREAFLQGLRDLGYVEGKNIAIEYRYTEGELDRLPELAAELVRLNVDVIVTGVY